MNEKSENVYSVYKHTNTFNGKVYIGITCRVPQKRWGKNGSGYKSNIHFWNAIQKYGWEIGFRHEILYSDLTKVQAEKLEIELISHYKSNYPEYGYNIANGGNSRGKMSESMKKKISIANTGKLRSLESRKKMSDRAKETSMERSERFKKVRSTFSNWNDGILMTEEQIDRFKGNTYRPVRCIELNKVYKSVSYASRELGLHQSLITKVCSGKRKTTGGYHFEYML